MRAHVSRSPRAALPPATLSERGSAAGSAGDAACPSLNPSVRPSRMRTDLLFFFRCGKMAFVSPPSAIELGISKRVPAKLGVAHTHDFHRHFTERTILFQADTNMLNEARTHIYAEHFN